MRNLISCTDYSAYGVRTKTTMTDKDTRIAELEAENERLKKELGGAHTAIRGLYGAVVTKDEALSALEPAEPEGQQPVAWIYELASFYNKVTDEYSGWEPGLSRTKPNAGRGRRNVQPLFTRPSEQAVTEALIDQVLDAAGDYMGVQYGNAALRHPIDRERVKSVMEAGR